MYHTVDMIETRKRNEKQWQAFKQLHFIILENYNITVTDDRAHMYVSCVATCVYVAVRQET